MKSHKIVKTQEGRRVRKRNRENMKLIGNSCKDGIHNPTIQKSNLILNGLSIPVYNAVQNIRGTL